MSPLTLSAANTGDFYGTYRVGGLYRSQFNQSSDIKGYSTVLGYVDAPLPYAIRKQDWIGLGLTYGNDKAGVGGLGRAEFLVSVAYHLQLGKNPRNHFSIGYQTGSISLRVTDPSKLQFYDPITGQINQDDVSIINQDKKAFTEHAGSAQFSAELSQRVRTKIGFTMAHLGKPVAIVSQNGTFKLPSRSTVFATFDVLINKSLALYPAFIYQITAKQKEFGANAIASYQLFKEKNLRANLGLGIRQSDSFQFLIGFDYNSIKFGAAYDLTNSLLRPNNGIEFAITYIGKIYKTPTPKQAIVCPRF